MITAQQVAAAEELLADSSPSLSFAKALFFGRFHAAGLPDYPDLRAHAEINRLVDEVEQFCQTAIDPAQIDRQQLLPESVIRGLGAHGVLGACLPREYGGGGLSQVDYCQLMRRIGYRCASTALFVNAHHSIGPRAVVLYGTSQQKERYLPRLASGEWISAFALTEPEAGSDAANVQTTATPSADGQGFVLNGQKRWITNGGIAQVLTVIGKVVRPDQPQGAITAFLITPDMPGFEVVEQRMEKCGVRGTATSRLAFKNVYVPRENVLGEIGKGLKIALTVLDYGRTTFGASCAGTAHFCLAKASAHTHGRVQFQQTLDSFELVKGKLAQIAANTFAIEAATYETALLLDRGAEDCMLETAMLKVFATETLWQIVHDTIQLHGGLAYFTDQPLERIMRDARINLIGEGANDVLRIFIALAGMREVGHELQELLSSFSHPWREASTWSHFVWHKVQRLCKSPDVPTQERTLVPAARQLGQRLGQFEACVEHLLREHRERIVDCQYQLARVADIAIDLYVNSCVLRRLEAELAQSANTSAWDPTVELDRKRGEYFLALANRRLGRNLSDLFDHDDDLANRVADRLQRSRLT